MAFLQDSGSFAGPAYARPLTQEEKDQLNKAMTGRHGLNLCKLLLRVIAARKRRIQRRKMLAQRKTNLPPANTSAEAKRLLKQSSIFARFNEASIDRMLDEAMPRAYNQREVIVYAGEPSHITGLSIVMSGDIKLVYSDLRVVVVSGPCLFGDLETVSEEPAGFLAYAEGACSMYNITTKRVMTELHAQSAAILQEIEGRIVPYREDVLVQNFPMNEAMMRGSWLCNGLQKADIDSLTRRMKPMCCFPGAEICHEGSSDPNIYFLRRGIVEGSSGGVSKGRIMPTMAFGEMSVIFNEKRGTTVKAITVCDFWILRRADLQQFLAVTPVAERLMWRTARILRSTWLSERRAMVEDRIVRYLAKTEVLQSLTEDEVRQVAKECNPKVYTQRELVCSTSEWCNRLIVVLRGRARSLKADYPQTYAVGSVIGQSCLAHKRWLFAASALCMVDAWEITSQRLQALLTGMGKLDAVVATSIEIYERLGDRLEVEDKAAYWLSDQKSPRVGRPCSSEGRQTAVEQKPPTFEKLQHLSPPRPYRRTFSPLALRCASVVTEPFPVAAHGGPSQFRDSADNNIVDADPWGRKPKGSSKPKEVSLFVPEEAISKSKMAEKDDMAFSLAAFDPDFNAGAGGTDWTNSTITARRFSVGTRANLTSVLLSEEQENLAQENVGESIKAPMNRERTENKNTIELVINTACTSACVIPWNMMLLLRRDSDEEFYATHQLNSIFNYDADSASESGGGGSEDQNFAVFAESPDAMTSVFSATRRPELTDAQKMKLNPYRPLRPHSYGVVFPAALGKQQPQQKALEFELPTVDASESLMEDMTKEMLESMENEGLDYPEDDTAENVNYLDEAWQEMMAREHRKHVRAQKYASQSSFVQSPRSEGSEGGGPTRNRRQSDAFLFGLIREEDSLTNTESNEFGCVVDSTGAFFGDALPPSDSKSGATSATFSIAGDAPGAVSVADDVDAVEYPRLQREIRSARSTLIHSSTLCKPLARPQSLTVGARPSRSAIFRSSKPPQQREQQRSLEPRPPPHSARGVHSRRTPAIRGGSAQIPRVLTATRKSMSRTGVRLAVRMDIDPNYKTGVPLLKVHR